MNAWEPIAAARPPEEAANEAGLAPFVVTRPPPGAPAAPLVFASPHSGRIYPTPMMDASHLDGAAIRRSEDAFVDGLIEGAPAYGATVIAARFARVWLDVNREAWELDPAMFEDELPPYARGRSARVAAGLGAIARIVCEGQEIYARKLNFAEARGRVEAVHRPYHEALAELIAQAREAHGAAILIDWHSMPAAAARHAAGGAGCDMVLGDRFGGASSPAVSRLVEREQAAMGYRVARNAPYAGGYTTEHYGRPAGRVHALQIEVNRALYLDEAKLAPTAGFAHLKADLEGLFGAVSMADWTSL
ncbi:MAG: N-formylglutamate amidohydrolase [Caulobacteraceae bacterium]